MTATDILNKLGARGVRLSVEDGKLRVSGKADELSGNLKTALAVNRDELLGLLSRSIDGPGRSDLIGRVREKRREATARLTQEEIDALVSREVELRPKLQRAYDRLLREEHERYIDPETNEEEWLAKWATMDSWIGEYESIIKALAGNNAVPGCCLCRTCQRPTPTAWLGTEDCFRCKNEEEVRN